MEKEKFYIPKSENLYFELKKVYMLLEEKEINNNFFIKIGKVFAIIGNRVIFSNTYEFITNKKENIFNMFKEIPFDKVKKYLNNTEALLDKNIFRR